MISTRWLQQRTPYWRRLDSLLDAVTRLGVRSLGRDELRELGLLYRQVATDLATVREDPASARVAADLNALLTRAHNTIYSAERPSRSAMATFVVDTFPAAFRRNAAHCLVAVLLFLAGAAAGAMLTISDPDFKNQLLGPEMVATIDRHEMWTHSIVAIKPFASSRIMTNNISVALMTFAMGITAIGTIYMLAFNGVLLGVVGAACGAAGMSVQLWSFVAPHGVLELPAIFIAGGAGLRLAQGLLFPGLLPRREAVARAAAEAVTLVLGCIPILVIAGIIEAFISPTDLAVPLKFGLAGALLTMLTLYLSLSRSRAAPLAAAGIVTGAPVP